MIKNWYQKLPIAHKIRVLLIAAGMAGICCFSTVYVYLGVQSLRTDLGTEAANTANMLGSRNATAIKFQSKDFAARNLEIIDSNTAHDAICLYDANGSVFSSYIKIKNWKCPSVAPLHNGTFKEIEREEAGRISVLKNIYDSGEVVGAVIILVNQTAISAYVSKQIGIMSVIALIAAVMCAVLANYLQRLISQPIIDIAKDVQVITGTSGFAGRIVEKYHDEIGQVAQAFNRTLSHMEVSLAETKKKYDAAVKGHSASLTRIQELQDQFLESSESFAVYIKLINDKVFGDDTSRYIKYQSDVISSMENYHTRLEAFKRLADIYELSIKSEQSEIDFIAYIENHIKGLKTELPFLSIRKGQGYVDLKAPMRVKVFQLALDETFSIIKNLIETLSGTVQFNPQLIVEYSILDSQLTFSLVNNNKNAEPPKLESFRFGRLAEADEDYADLHEEEEQNYKKGSIEDPTVAQEFLDPEIIGRADLRYVFDSVNYIANANAIAVEHRFAPEELHIIIHLESMLVSQSNLFTRLELQ